MSSAMCRVLMAGGGSGGHVFPAFAVASAIRSTLKLRNESVAFRFAGASDGVEAELSREAGVDFAPIRARPLRGQGPVAQLSGAATTALGVLDALRLIQQFNPHVALLTGGFVSAPVGLAAWLLRRPIVLLQPDVEPGWTLRALAPIANKVCIAHERSRERYPDRKVALTGYPLRPGFLNLDRAAARSHFRLSDDPAILVTGAVRGAQRINDCISDRLPDWLQHAQLMHITGAADFDRFSQLRNTLPQALRTRYRLYPYLSDDMPLAMAACDLVASRAGASVTAEYPAASLPAILIPIGEAGGHQRANAQLLADAGAARIIRDERVTTELFPLVVELLADRDQLGHMRAAMSALHQENAAADVAQVVLNVAK